MTPAEEKHYGRLIGRTITGLAESPDPYGGLPFPGLRLDNGWVIWVLCDPEGNGPGFLEIQEAGHSKR